MNFRKIASIYSIVMGISMISMWIFFLFTNQVPEVNSALLKISYHLIAEFLTAILLIISGFGLFTHKGWGFHLYLISMGMLLYTVIVSAGYYADLGDMIMVCMFSVFQVLTLLFVCVAFYQNKEIVKKEN